MFDPITALGFIFILGALIFIHESGHYFVAKVLGIKVEVFSLGFGPKLLKFEKGGTEYCLSALPLGGYVKMLGENPDETLRGSREEFQSRTKLERFMVLVMGALLNIVLAVVLMSGLYMHGVPEPGYMSHPPIVGALDPNGAAAAAGIQVGDMIVAVDGQPTPRWPDMQLVVALNPGRALDFTVERGEETVDIPVTPGQTERERIGVVGIYPRFRIQIAQVTPGGPADQAGLRPEDVLLAVEGEELFGPSGSERFVNVVSSSVGHPVRFTIQRDGEVREIAVTPREKPGDEASRGWIDVALSEQKGTVRYGLFDAVAKSARHNWENAGILFLTLKKLISGQLSPRTLSGPIDIYLMTGESLRRGLVFYISFMAMVSLQLGVINLLPIPVMDGGHIFILLLEGIIRRDLSMKIKERVMQFGFILLLLIMGSVIYLDIHKNFFTGD